ncbi:unnamed protein product [marine sediment metagenome]|uniref:Uncharacterized protein n=1 Tax=marine sediment metagenome TaxID=412755 RepID=X1UEF0_9ZZZZ
MEAPTLKAYYQGGYGSVVSTAIDKFMYVTVNNPFIYYALSMKYNLNIKTIIEFFVGRLKGD